MNRESLEKQIRKLENEILMMEIKGMDSGLCCDCCTIEDQISWKREEISSLREELGSVE